MNILNEFSLLDVVPSMNLAFKLLILNFGQHLDVSVKYIFFQVVLLIFQLLEFISSHLDQCLGRLSTQADFDPSCTISEQRPEEVHMCLYNLFITFLASVKPRRLLEFRVTFFTAHVGHAVSATHHSCDVASQCLKLNHVTIGLDVRY